MSFDRVPSTDSLQSAQIDRPITGAGVEGRLSVLRASMTSIVSNGSDSEPGSRSGSTMLTKEQTSFMQQRNSRFTGPESDSSSSEDEEDTRREGGHEFHTHMVTREGLLDFELMAADIEAVLRKVREHVHSTKHHNVLSTLPPTFKL
jgi:hypothetical protein